MSIPDGDSMRMAEAKEVDLALDFIRTCVDKNECILV